MPVITTKSTTHDLKPQAAEKEPSLWRCFSPKLATAINDEQPDISAAVVLGRLALLSKNNYTWTLIDGKRHCFRSISQLKEECPGIGCVAKALTRAKKKGFLEARKVKKKLLYHLPEHIRKMCDTSKGSIWYHIEDAERYGIEAATLLANLQWQAEKCQDVTHTVFDGWKYFHLPPAKLAEHLPMSRWTIVRHLKKMSEGKEASLVEHPTKKHFYRRRGPDEKMSTCSDTPCAKGNQHGAERQVDVAEGNKSQGVISNEKINEEEKWDFTSIPAPASPALEFSCSPPALSEKLNNLMNLANESLNRRRKSGQLTGTPVLLLPHPDETPFDDFSSVTMNCGFDFDILPDFQRLGQWTNELAEDMQLAFEFRKLPFTNQDLQTFRKFFWDNPHIDSLHLIEVLEACLFVQNPKRYIFEGIEITSYYLPCDQDVYDDNYNNFRFPKRVKSASYFLHRLPEILIQLNPELYRYSTDHFSRLDYSYLGKPRVNRFVQQCWNGEWVGKVRCGFPDSDLTPSKPRERDLVTAFRV